MEFSGAKNQHCSEGDVRRALRALADAPAWLRPPDLSPAAEPLRLPGLYAWSVDAEGAAELAEALGLRLEAGLTYAGQTGATKWPSGRVGSTTLGDRIVKNHLRGSIYASTFRRTLAACLMEALKLEPAGSRRLTSESEQRLSAWMSRNLAVALHSYAQRDALSDLEQRVLAVLDPPLNLEGMTPTPLRARLSDLRRDLTAAVGGRNRSAARAPRRSAGGGKPQRATRSTTLHEEIADILQEAGAPLTTKEIAAQVNARGRYLKRDGSRVTDFQIHGRTRNYPALFVREGATVRLRQASA